MSDQSQNIIRRAGPSDATWLARATDAAYTKYIERIGRKPQPMTADYAAMIAEHEVWILEVEDEHDAGNHNDPAGAIVLIHEPDALLIYSVLVDPRYQRRGLGRRLLDGAEERARSSGYDCIRLYTNERMHENIALYQSLGYIETGREPYKGFHVVYLAKSI